MQGELRLLVCMYVLLAPLTGCSASIATPQSATAVAVGDVVDETGLGLDAAALAPLRGALRDGLATADVAGPTNGILQPAIQVQPRLIQCPLPAATGGVEGCLGSVGVRLVPSHRLAFETVVRAPAGAGLTELGADMASAARRALHPPTEPAAERGEDISATSAAVRYLGAGRFVIGHEVIDLHAIAHAHDPAVDPDVPLGTDVALDEASPTGGNSRRGYAVITLYQVDPPLTGLPSREPGVDRGTDFRDPANLVKAAYTNYVSPVFTDAPNPLHVASHPIGLNRPGFAGG